MRKPSMKDKTRWALDIWTYDTKLNILSNHIKDFYKPYYKIYGFYYLRKCKKVIFTFGKLNFSNEVFHKTRGRRRGFKLRDIYVVSLAEIKDTRCYYNHIAISKLTEHYIKINILINLTR